MSETIYPDIYTCANFDGDLAFLRAKVEERLGGAGETTIDLQERLDAELAWIERSGMVASWVALARFVEAAEERHIPLGALLGSADGTLLGVALGSLPAVYVNTPVPLMGGSAIPVPPGVEVPAGRRDEMLRALGHGEWAEWMPDVGVEDGRAVLWLYPSSALGVLDSSLALAPQHPSGDFVPESDLSQWWPALSEGAIALLKKGQVEGIPYLSPVALKDWKGDISPEIVSAMVARSGAAHGALNPLEGVAAWTEHTGDTGGALLYYDQFVRIVEDSSGMTPAEIPALRVAMLKAEKGSEGALHARFVEGCTAKGLDDAATAMLWAALNPSAPGLISRHVALAWARAVLRLVEVKASHPAAFFAAALDARWERGGLASIKPLAEDARRCGVPLLPPDVERSLAVPSLESVDGGWAIRWGLAYLSGWNHPVAERFVEARASANGYRSLQDIASGASTAGLSPAQLEAFVRSGACDRLGGRDALLSALVAGKPPVEKQEPPPGPRLRYARRTWEEQNLGVGFTGASEIDELRRALEAGGDWSGRLTGCARIGVAQAGESVYLVGLMHDVRLLDADDGQMAVAWLEDLDGAIELVAFPPNYKRHAALWTEGNMVIVTARVSAHPDGSGVYLLCEHLAPYRVEADEQELALNITIKPSKHGAAEDTTPLPAPTATSANGGSHKPSLTSQITATENPKSKIETPKSEESPAYELIITLPASMDDREDIDRMIRLDNLLKTHVGPDTVVLRIPYSPETGSYTKAQLPRGVRYSSVLEMEIRELLGTDALALIKLLG